MCMRYLIKNGSIIDPARRVATIGNVLVEDGKVVQVIDLADLTLRPSRSMSTPRLSMHAAP